ncbi:MAG: hypothetical protein H7175_03795 [Burkholderiales bacterium]|nr:hypothetical protein [Anaerolineae bacterium]
MIPEKVTLVSLEKFRERAAGKKAILLYPWTNYRNIFLTHFLSSVEAGLLYYRIPENQTMLTEWLSDLVKEFDQFLDSFGRNLQPALRNGDPATLGEALAADLGEYSSEPVVLFLDEFDRVPLDDDFNRFVSALVETLPSHVQLAFSSRRLTYQPWYDMVANGDAIVLGTEHRKDDVMFTIENKPRPQLEVYSLGRGYALVNGQLITNWDGALPRNLFFYFMDHPLVTRDEIFSTFWPNLSVKEATNVFHVTKRKISERISMKVDGPSNYELTQYSGGFYMPSEKVVRHYDVADFQESVERAFMVGNDEEETKLLSRAIELYKAPFLQMVEMDWVVDRREQLKNMYAQSLIGMARICKRRNDFDSALGFFVRALKETSEREDIHREVMSIYLKQGRVEDARMQYQNLSQTLNQKLNIGPSRESRELYDLIEAQS